MKINHAIFALLFILLLQACSKGASVQEQALPVQSAQNLGTAPNTHPQNTGESFTGPTPYLLSLEPSLTHTPTPTPITTAPITTAPITTAPITTAPITTAPITTAPITTAPITTAPITTAPITTAPITTAPITTAPITTAPITTAPTTTAPTTTAPTKPLPAPAPLPPQTKGPKKEAPKVIPATETNSPPPAEKPKPVESIPTAVIETKNPVLTAMINHDLSCEEVIQSLRDLKNKWIHDYRKMTAQDRKTSLESLSPRSFAEAPVRPLSRNVIMVNKVERKMYHPLFQKKGSIYPCYIGAQGQSCEDEKVSVYLYLDQRLFRFTLFAFHNDTLVEEKSSMGIIKVKIGASFYYLQTNTASEVTGMISADFKENLPIDFQDEILDPKLVKESFKVTSAVFKSPSFLEYLRQENQKFILDEHALIAEEFVDQYSTEYSEFSQLLNQKINRNFDFETSTIAQGSIALDMLGNLIRKSTQLGKFYSEDDSTMDYFGDFQLTKNLLRAIYGSSSCSKSHLSSPENKIQASESFLKALMDKNKEDAAFFQSVHSQKRG